MYRISFFSLLSHELHVSLQHKIVVYLDPSKQEKPLPTLVIILFSIQ